MRKRRSGLMCAWILPLLAGGLFFGCSSGSSVGFGTGGQGGSGAQPGCTAPNCSACQGCYALCYCQNGNANQCIKACASGTGGSGAGGTGAGGTSAGGTSAGGSSTGGSSTGGSSTGGSSTGGTSSDPFAAARQTCIDHINQLRATKGRKPYTRWKSIEACVDTQATYDSNNGPHADFIGGKTCGATSQGECPGQGPSSVTNCIDLMWAEKNYSICSGCDSCPNLMQCWNGGCPNCKCVSGSNTCGHYMALVDPVQTMAACGFSTNGKPYTTIDYK